MRLDHRPFDVAVIGATGFTGRLACEYLHTKCPDVKWLATARSETKLEQLRAELGLESSQTRVVDCTDPAGLSALATECSVVANFAGTPFLDKALPVVEQCVTHACHYVDITGEVPLQRASYDKYHEAACATKTLIIHACGYDSVPSDLGAFLAVQELKEKHGVACSELKAFAGASSGGVSGGTLATALGLMSGRFKAMPGMQEAAARGAYALDPEGAKGGVDTGDYGGVAFDRRVESWHMPNIMAGVNAPVVRKSAALLAYSTTPGQCKYSEVQAVKTMLGACMGTAAMAAGGLCLALPPVRRLLFWLKLLPLPGEGPSKETREKGHFHTWVLGVGEAEQGAPPPMVIADVRSGVAGDPGYKATAQMSVEAALCLALDRGECEASGGVLTPAAGLGHALVARLRRSGMELGVRPLNSPPKTPSRKAKGAEKPSFVA